MPFLSLLSVPVFLVQKTFVSQIACRLFVIAYIGQPFVVGYLLYRHVAFFGGEAQPFSAGAPYAPLGQEGEVVICLPEAVELFVPAVACGRLLRQKIHYMDVGKAMVYAILYQLQFLQIQEESANAGFAPAEKACPGVEALNGVAARAGYRPAIERHAAFAVVDVGDKDAVGFRFAGGREVVKRMGSE